MSTDKIIRIGFFVAVTLVVVVSMDVVFNLKFFSTILTPKIYFILSWVNIAFLLAFTGFAIYRKSIQLFLVFFVISFLLFLLMMFDFRFVPKL
ncbi:MAG: hypothetical protein RL204_2238 [Bacteroidota bacterium]|jgi:hypothetical protein